MHNVGLLVVGGVIALGVLEGCEGGGGKGGDAGTSLTASAFRDQYCALIGPCCTEAGLAAQCPAVVNAAAMVGYYDPTAAAACLDELRARHATADFCAGFGIAYASVLPTAWIGAIPECLPVFQAHGTTAIGETCRLDNDCAVVPTGVARCVTSFTDAHGGSTIAMACTHLTDGTQGDPCVGTFSFEIGGTSWVTDPTPTEGSLCDHAKNLRCDGTTQVCVATHTDGDACSEAFDCGAASYCDFSIGTCAPRRVAGATCTDAAGACAGWASCNVTSMTCVLPLDAGAACTSVIGQVSPCASGQCTDGRCVGVLRELCLP
jgi:hypothetical protein